MKHATLVPARHYGFRDRGAVTPSYRADVLVVTSLTRRSSPLALEYVAARRAAGSVVLSEFCSTRYVFEDSDLR